MGAKEDSADGKLIGKGFSSKEVKLSRLGSGSDSPLQAIYIWRNPDVMPTKATYRQDDSTGRLCLPPRGCAPDWDTKQLQFVQELSSALSPQDQPPGKPLQTFWDQLSQGKKQLIEEAFEMEKPKQRRERMQRNILKVKDVAKDMGNYTTLPQIPTRMALLPLLVALGMLGQTQGSRYATILDLKRDKASPEPSKSPRLKPFPHGGGSLQPRKCQPSLWSS